MPESFPVPVRDDLREIEPYGAPQLDVPVRLNTNETPEPPPAAFTELLAQRLAGLELNRYPDRRAFELRAELGARVGLPAEQTWVANGSNEALTQLFQAYGGPGRKVLFALPGYSAHPLLARVASTDSVYVELDAGLQLSEAAVRAAIEERDPDLICFANPHNPSGMRIPPEIFRTVHDASRALVIADEAYVEFAARGAHASPSESAVGLLGELERLVVCRTFSKAFSLAGLRLGYLYTHQWVIDGIRKVRLPYHVDAVKQEAGLAALELADEAMAHITRTVDERERVSAALQELGLQVWPSAANFLLFRPDAQSSAHPPARGIFDALLERGVLIRDFSTSPGLTGCLRVSIGTRDENDAFLKALEETLS